MKVVICGGGFAAAEALLRLHRLAGDRVEVTLLSPDEHLRYRPHAVLSPFIGEPAARYPIRKLTVATDAQWIHDRLASVDFRSRSVHTADGQTLKYDALLLAPGARERKPNPHVALFTDRTEGATYRGIIEGIDSGAVTGVTLIEPPGPCWPLPLYELALLTAKHTRDRGLPVEITLATPHPHPLYPFGDSVGATMQRLLQAVGVAVHLRTSVQFLGPQSVRLTPADLPIKQGGLAGWLPNKPTSPPDSVPT